MLIIQEFDHRFKTSVIDTLLSKSIKFKLGHGSYQSSTNKDLVTFSQKDDQELLITALELSSLVQCPTLWINSKNFCTLISALPDGAFYTPKGALKQVTSTQSQKYLHSMIFDGLYFVYE